MEKETRSKKKRILLFILLVIVLLSILASVTYFHTPTIVQLLRNGDVEGIENYVRSAGNRGRFFLIMFQTIETVAIVLPALPVYICAGVVYGRLEGTIICYLTNIVVNLLMFIVIRKLKDKADELIGGGKNRKIEEWLKSSPYPERAVFILCLFPVIPNGMITILASKTALSEKEYARALSVGCLPGIAISVFFGNFLMNWLINFLHTAL